MSDTFLMKDNTFNENTKDVKSYTAENTKDAIVIKNLTKRTFIPIGRRRFS